MFLVNDQDLDFAYPSSNRISFEALNSTAERSESGDMKVIDQVNRVVKIELTWDIISVADMEKLCQKFRIDISSIGQPYEPKNIEDLTFRIMCRVFTGIRSFTVYVGDTIQGELVDWSGSDGTHWRDVSINLIGTGESWNV